MKHTYGPWKHDENRNVIESETQWEIKPCKKDGEEGIRKQVISTFAAMGGDNPQADIKLIVAAPELLEALIGLKEAYYEIQHELYPHLGTEISSPPYVYALDIIRKATL